MRRAKVWEGRLGVVCFGAGWVVIGVNFGRHGFQVSRVPFYEPGRYGPIRAGSKWARPAVW